MKRKRSDGVLAEELMKEIFGIHGIPVVVHADRGTSMTSKTVATLLADLGVTRSHSRPRVSNDNPYSESLFKTMKYAPAFPERFGSLGDARGFMDRFVTAYNHEPRRRPLRARPSRRRDEIGGTGRGPRSSPRTVHHDRRSQDPGAPHRRLDQPASSRKPSCLTITGLKHLEKFRSSEWCVAASVTAGG
jgi:hypothetical protein